jgi:hypothetical protein
MMSRHRADNDRLPSRAADAETRALWLLLAAGLALLLAAAAASGQERAFTASRTDRLQGTLPPGTRLRVSNVNGDIVASSGREFSAVVTTTVTASSQTLAGQILDKTRILQSSEDEEYRLETRWPGQTGPRSRQRRQNSLFCRDCRIASRYELIVPPGFAASLQTVNGEVRVNGLDGDLEVHSVNGNLQILGSRRSLGAQTVNGRVEATAAALPPAASWQLQTVNGAVTATLPKDAKFAWSASTMSGTIASSFALAPGQDEAALAPVAPPAAPARPPRPQRAPRAAVIVSAEGDEALIDTEELAREIEESMREVEVEAREVERITRHVRFTLPERRYAATVGGGGATIRSSTLNGSITLLAAGTRAADAKPLVSSRRTIVVTVPRVVHVPEVRLRVPLERLEASPRPERSETPEADEERQVEIVRGDIAGDLLSTSNGSYHVGHVSGKVRILTHAGEIHIASAGSGADIKTYGGDIRIGQVRGDLRAQTLAGDVRAGDVAGSVKAETAGGDIRIDRVTGAAIARTGGGDIVLPAVGGAVDAETGGGEVRIGVLSRLLKNGISIRNAGGDVVLTLPADFRGELDLEVDGPVDPEDIFIRSEFPGVAVTRGADSQRASGVLNGGGPRVLVRTSSGSIRLLRGPAAGSE